ncbi:MAG: hypothetical protein AB9835_07695 [Eubacteriales bacterium]
MTIREFEEGTTKKNGKVLRWIFLSVKLLIMLVLLLVSLPFIIIWFVIKDAMFKASLKRGMRQAGADEEAVNDMSAAFPTIGQLIKLAKQKI